MKKNKTDKCKTCLYADMCSPLVKGGCDYYVNLNETEEDKRIIRRERGEFRSEWFKYTKDDRD